MQDAEIGDARGHGDFVGVANAVRHRERIRSWASRTRADHDDTLEIIRAVTRIDCPERALLWVLHILGWRDHSRQVRDVFDRKLYPRVIDGNPVQTVG